MGLRRLLEECLSFKLEPQIRSVFLANLGLCYGYAHLGMLRESKRELQICEQNSVEYQLPMGPIYGWLRHVCERLGEKAESEQYARLARPV